MDFHHYKERTLKSFDRQAPSFDVGYCGRLSRACYPHVLAALEPLDFSSVLDLGCGTGNVLCLLLRQRPEIRAYGLDLSGKMLEVARRKLGERAELTRGDAESLPYPDRRFDAVICCKSFHHYPDPAAVLREVRRVLRPGGTLLLCDTALRFPVRQAVNFALLFGRGGDVRVYSKKKVLLLLESAGFRPLRWSRPAPLIFLCLAERPPGGAEKKGCFQSASMV